METLEVDKVDQQLEIDTGTPTSIVNERDYHQNWTAAPQEAAIAPVKLFT